MKLVKNYIKDIMNVLLETIQSILKNHVKMKSELKCILEMLKYNGLFIGVTMVLETIQIILIVHVKCFLEMQDYNELFICVKTECDSNETC